MLSVHELTFKQRKRLFLNGKIKSVNITTLIGEKLIRSTIYYKRTNVNETLQLIIGIDIVI